MGEIGQTPNHLVKVDNWPLFFLQRLHHFYRKKSHCDLTLLFSTLDTVKSIKVHKLVLHACTDYFETLDIKQDSEHGEFLQLSNEMHPDVVIPIISFMYTGKLEFPVTLQPRLYEAATKLRMTILTKLLDVQPSKTVKKPDQILGDSSAKGSVLEKEISQPSVITESNQEACNVNIISTEIPVITTGLNSPSSFKPSEEPLIKVIPATVIPSQTKLNLNKDLTIVQPDISCIKTNNQIKAKVLKKNLGLQVTTVSAKPKVIDISLPPTLPGRKLPVWKRKVPFTGSQVVTENVGCRRGILRRTGSPKPTRFEWDEEIIDSITLKPVEDALKILSHDRSSKILYPIKLDGEEQQQQQQQREEDDSAKRSLDSACSESPPYKRSKSDLQDMKEYGKQQQLRNEILCSEENSDDMMDGDELYGTCDDEPDDLPSFQPSTPKPILKTVPKPEPPLSSKRVRFSLEGKENNQQQQNESANEVIFAKQSEVPVVKEKLVVPMDVSQIQSGKHHIKIVSEVLKKYPNLATRENIKLKVVSKNPAAVPPIVQQAVEGDTGAGNKSSSSLVSYIFLTNKSTGDGVSLKGIKDKRFDVENVTGPWFCYACNEMNPINFESYYIYRKHLVEVHDLKIDARICEYCGMKNSKRNHLLHHMYTKHGIDPPAHVSFPKCSECNYIALSEGLLLKHKSSHDPKGLTCYLCNVVFKSYSSMQIHLNSTWHKSKVNEVSIDFCDYPCPFCDARFRNGHLVSVFHAEKAAQKDWKQIYRCPYCEGVFEHGDKLRKHIVSVHWGKSSSICKQDSETEEYEPQSGQQLQYTEEAEDSGEGQPSMESRPSSEMESISNVASSIATSLNLVGNEQTVVYYEQRTDEQDIGREATVEEGDEGKDYIIAGSVEDVISRQCQESSDTNDPSSLKSDDSNSMTSNTEEVNPTSCSDHDYSEPQVDENISQVISVHQVGNQINQIPETSVIRQVLPNQRLVFSNQGNVVFQSPCVTLPQSVLLTPGKVVIPQIADGDQNIILSQVLPQTRIILSSQILQQSGSINMNDGNSTIVFANPEVTEHMENMQTTTLQFPVEPQENVTQNEQEKPIKEIIVLDDENQTGEEKEEISNDSVTEKEEISNDSVTEKEEISNDSVTEKEVEVLEILQEPSEGDQDATPEKVEESPPASETATDDFKVGHGNRVETAKIVDDWDESNENQNNIECRSDGPSRPEFF